MPKREPDPEPLDEEQLEPELPTVGERLRAAREEKKLTLEDVAAQTRIPRRHLESIEKAAWDDLPAPTYTIGFAKSYASAVGLDRTEIGDQLREEMGGQRFAANAGEVFEPADPRRTMPKGLVIGALVAVVVLIAVMTWLNKRSLEEPTSAENAAVAESSAPAPAAPKAAAPAATAASAVVQGPVVLTATAPAWIKVSDQGKKLFEGVLQPGQTFPVPSTATAPVLKTGKPEALKVTVGSAVAPPVGPAATTVSNVSLLAADLMKVPAAPQGTAVQAPATVPAAGQPQANTAE
jgi:cytoskeletal protein RodZ